MNYAVIFTYSFDDEVPVYLFAHEDEAKKFLRESYLEELRIDTEENRWDSVGEISSDGWYAKITTNFYSGYTRTDVTGFRIGNIYQ